MFSAGKTRVRPPRALQICGSILVLCGLVFCHFGCGSSDSEVDPNDREAVARAFMDQLIVGTITPGTIGFHEIPEQFVQDGKALYTRYGCTVCHGMDGHGDGPVAYTLKPSPRDFRDPGAYRVGRDVVTIAGTLRDGMPDSPSMVPFPHIKDEERFKIAMYVASLQPADDLEIAGTWVRATPPNRDVTAAYLVIKNRSDRARELLSVETPAAEYTELHTMRHVDDMMEMEEDRTPGGSSAGRGGIGARRKPHHVVRCETTDGGRRLGIPDFAFRRPVDPERNRRSVEGQVMGGPIMRT